MDNVSEVYLLIYVTEKKHEVLGAYTDVESLKSSRKQVIKALATKEFALFNEINLEGRTKSENEAFAKTKAEGMIKHTRVKPNDWNLDTILQDY